MVEEKKDLNSSQSVADSDLNNAQTVAVQDLNQPVTGEQDEKLADGSLKREKTVKYEEFEKKNVALKAAEEALLLSDQKLTQAIQLQQQAAYTQQVQAPVAQPKTTYELAMQQLSITGDDLYGENIMKVNIRTAELDKALNQQNAAISSTQQFVTSHPDFEQVVGSVNLANGQITAWSTEALLLKQTKPHSFQTAQSAYDAIMEQREVVELRKNAEVNQEHLNRQGVDTQTAPLGGSAAGGGGAGDVNPQMLSRKAVEEIERKLANGEQV